MSTIATCLWFDGNAEEAANFYVSLLPDSRIDKVQKNASDGPSGKVGSVLIIQFTLAGQPFQALNGGMKVEYNIAMSLSVSCEDQAEVDRLWSALTKDGGSEVQCGWLKDRFGVSWQIVPKALFRLLADPDPARAKRAMEAMMEMVKIDIAAVEKAAAGK